MSFTRSGRSDLAIINRSFWPIYPVIGEALMQLAETVSEQSNVTVIMQDHVGIRGKLREAGRGRNVRFLPCKAWSSSASGVLVRALDALFFMVWVAMSLLRTRPRTVYVSTDPPVVVPFITMIYCRVFRARCIYHLQDIHPEATNVVMPVNGLLFRFLRGVDAWVMRNASALITITGEMRDEMVARSGSQRPIHVVSNPAVSFDNIVWPEHKIRGFSFCGNAGRLQRMPLVMAAIKTYLDEGGQQAFCFAGGGIYAGDLRRLDETYEQVTYLGQVSPGEAAQVNCDYEWALLPIEDEVCRFAFPSKSSSYVLAGARILAVCGQDTSVASWVNEHSLGVSVRPDERELADMFHAIERGDGPTELPSGKRGELADDLSFGKFVTTLKSIVMPESR